MTDDLTILANSPNKDGDSDVIKSPVVRALLSHFVRWSELVDVNEVQICVLNEHSEGEECGFH